MAETILFEIMIVIGLSGLYYAIYKLYRPLFIESDIANNVTIAKFNLYTQVLKDKGLWVEDEKDNTFEQEIKEEVKKKYQEKK